MLECVINVSEGRDKNLVDRIAAAVSTTNDSGLLDVHSDPDHNRSVFTLVGPDGPRALTRRAVELLDMGRHDGEHPRLGVVDVVPFVALVGSTHDDAIAARNAFAQWAADELRLPVFLYGPERTLPDIRRSAWTTLQPDVGPSAPHPTAGAVCVGVRPVLIAYNVALDTTDMALARRIVGQVRRPGLRVLPFFVAGSVQISMNIVDADAVSVADAYDTVAVVAQNNGTTIRGAELVGLLPERQLLMNDESRWRQLDIGREKTIEARLARRA